MPIELLICLNCGTVELWNCLNCGIAWIAELLICRIACVHLASHYEEVLFLLDSKFIWKYRKELQSEIAMSLNLQSMYSLQL